MLVNLSEKEVSFKIVYYGPGLCGKTTNLLYIYSKTTGEKGDLVNLANREDRTIFFDFASLELGKLGGLSVKFGLYTVPGQSIYSATRRLVLKGVDGIVFVADSSPKAMKRNIVSLQELGYYLRQVGEKSVSQIPMVIQFNKRDLPDALPITTLEKLNIWLVPTVEAVATTGKGVMETLNLIIKLVLKENSKVFRKR